MSQLGLLRIWFVLMLCNPMLLTLEVRAQWEEDEVETDACFSPPNAKALKLLEKGQNGSKYERAERVQFLEAAFEQDEACMECLFEWGRLEFNEIKRSQGSFQPAKMPLLQLLEMCPDFRADAWYMLGAMAYADRAYQDALMYFEAYLRWPAAPEEVMGKRWEKQAEEVREVLPLIHFELDFRKNEGRYAPESIPPVSLESDEFLPALSPDGSLLFFTRRIRYKAKGDVVSTEKEIFHVAERAVGSEFDAGSPLEEPFNENARYGGASISVDNRELYIAASNPVPGNPENIDLFVTRYRIIDRDETGAFSYVWENFEPVTAINSPMGWEAQPALSADGQTLFYAGVNADSKLDANGNPTMDIYVSQRGADGTWGAPTALPAPINSSYNDKAPFLHPDGKTLYFASDREPSGGGYDIWTAQRDEEGVWSVPANFGAPLNTSGDEHGLVVSTNGQEAFFSSRRNGTKAMDIMRFPVPEEFQPDDVFIVQGSLEDNDGSVPEGARLYLQYAQSKEVQEIRFNQEDGHFASVVRVLEGEDVLLVAEADGIAFETQVLFDHTTSAAPTSAIEADVSLSPAKDGEPFEIGDIQFTTNSAEINRTSLLMLELFAAYLIRNEAVGVHIKGHTDNRGQAKDNQLLSERRAASVAASLVSFGVSPDRVSHEGLGQTSPIVSNETDEGRARNRRTEFEIRLKK